MKIEVVLPPRVTQQLMEQIRNGNFEAIARSVKVIDAEHAKAMNASDEEFLKTIIRETVGFKGLNTVVKSSLRESMSDVFEDYLESLETDEEPSPGRKSTFSGVQNRRISFRMAPKRVAES